MAGEMLRLYAASATEARALVRAARADPRIADRVTRLVGPQLAPEVSVTALSDLLDESPERRHDDPLPAWRALEAVVAALAWQTGQTGPYRRSWLPDFDRQLARGGVPADLRLEPLMRLPGLPGLPLEPAPTGTATVLPPAAVQRLLRSWTEARSRMTEPDVTDDVLGVAGQIPDLGARAARLGRPAPDLIWVFGGVGPQAPATRPERWADHIRRANFEPDPLAGVDDTELATYAVADPAGGQYVLRWRLTNGGVNATWQGSGGAGAQWNGRLSAEWGAAFEQAMAATHFPQGPAPDEANFLLRFGDEATGKQLLGSVAAAGRDPVWHPVLALLNGALAALCGRPVHGVAPERGWLVPLL